MEYKNKHFYFLIGFASIYFILMSLFALWKYWGYMHSAYDIGNTVQPLWNLIDSGKPISTLNHPFEPHNRFGFHFTPIILLLTPIYMLAGIEGLIISHVFFITATSLVIFKICKELKFSDAQSLIFGILFLMCLFTVNGLFWDFRPISVGCLLVATSYLFILRKNFFALILTCLFLLTVKESFGAYVAGFGLIWAWHHKEHKKGLALFAFGLIAAFLIVTQIMPALLGTEEHAMLAKGKESINRYFWIFDEAEIRNKYFSEIFLKDPAPYIYLFLFFASFLFMPLLAPIFLIPAGGDFLLNLFSAIGLPRAPYSYHSTAIIPCMFVATAIVLSKKKSKEVLLFGTFISTILLSYWLLPFPVPGSQNVWMHKKFVNYYDPDIEPIKELVGESSIASQINIGGYFSERKELYPYPEGLEKAEFVIINIYFPSDNEHFIWGNPQDEAEKLLQDPRFDLVYSENNWRVFKRK